MNTVSVFLIATISLISCKSEIEKTILPRDLDRKFNDYWFSGEAEVSTYKLSQNRYGETRDGHATLIYVSEDFETEKQIKADFKNPKNTSVLKLNSIKKFYTGIYPYSIMQSSFSPVFTKEKALKTTASIQEWCGHTYIQINNKEQLQITAHSYFENEGDQNLKLNSAVTENEIWNLIRLSGSKELPVDEFNMLPSLEFIRLKHAEIKTYKAFGKVTSNQNILSYTISYPNLKRVLTINFNSKFPFIIENWTEKIGNEIPTTAKRITTQKLSYWEMNSNDFLIKRKELGLPLN